MRPKIPHAGAGSGGARAGAYNDDVMRVRPGRIAVALALAAAVAWVAFAGVSLDASWLGARLARALGDAIGRPVRIEAPLALHVSLRPSAVARALAVENPAGFPVRDFATIGELRLAVDLLPLLRGEVRVRELAAADVTLHPARGPDGAPNWILGSGRPPDAAPSADLPKLDIHRVSLSRVRLHVAGQRTVEVAELVGEARRSAPTRITARGTLDGRVAWSVALDGGPLDGLHGDAPWPFALRAEAGGATLVADGDVTDATGAPRLALRVGARTPDVAATAAGFGASVPALGAAALVADIAGGQGRWRIGDIGVAVGPSTLAGMLEYDAAGARPRLAGMLAAARLDLAPLFASSPGAQGEPETLAQTFRELERLDLGVRRYADLDVDVKLDVADVDGIPGDLRDVSVRVVAGAQRVAMPVAFMLAGARFAGEATAEIAATPARFRATLAAGESPFGGIAEVLFGAPYVDGRIREMRFELDTEGERPGELVSRLAVRGRLAGAALTYGNFEGGEPVRMSIDRADLVQPRGGRLSADVRGTLLGRPLAGTLKADSLEHVIREGNTRLGLEASSGGVRAKVDGRLTETRAESGPDLDVRLTARRAAELAPWLGWASTSDAPVDLRGRVQVRAGGTSLLGGAADVGRSAMRADVIAATAGGRSVRRVAVAAERIDAAELQSLGNPRDQRRDGVVDIPLLPAGLDLGDADLDVRVKRVDGLALRVTDLVFEGRVRGGTLPPAPLALVLEGVPLDGALAVELAARVPRAQLWLQGRDVEVSRWLRALGVGANVEATAGDLRLYADVRDTTVGRALDASSLVASIGEGRLVVRDRNTKAALRLRIEQGEMRADPGAPLQATLKGRMFRAPVELALVTGRLRQFVEARRMPLQINLSGAGARLTIAGEVAPRVAEPDVDLVVGLTGTSFAELRPLLRTSLPPWGPYAGAARLRISKWGYEVEDLRFAVGSSVLEGRGALDTSRAKPLLSVALDATTIQLDDFSLAEWSPFDAPAGTDTRSMAAQIQEGAAEAGAQVQALLDPALLAAYDADVKVDVRQVLSGRDALGRGLARAKVADGALDLDPVEVAMTGGAARFTAVYRPRGEAIETRARMKVDRFDYGVIARRVQPDTDLAGTFSLDLDVTGSSPRLAGAIARGSGHLDLAVWPERLHAGVFDLWATNVFLAVLPALNADVTKVNCAIGEFELAYGVLTSRRLLIDTTNTRAQGSAVADLPGNTIEARLVPQAKVPQFFALATPIEVAGPLEKPVVRVKPGEVFATVARWVTSLVVVPIQKLTATPPPADGADVCRVTPRGAMR
jgi:hypothetical protein